MLYSTIRNVVILAFASLAIALPLDTDKRDPKKDIGIGISFKYPFKAAEGAEGAEGTQVEKRGKDAVEFRYPIFKVAEGAEVEKRGNDAVEFRYPIFKVAEGAEVEKRDPKKDIGIGISFKYPFKAAEGAEGAEGTQVEKRGKDAVEFRYPIFKASEGAAEKRDPKGPYADAIAAADARDILG